MIYFNEFDPFASQWLRNLFPSASVDDRSISDVAATDVVRFDRCHFFGGIGGWEYALRLAGWPDGLPVWTGSCPCQPFSVAGKRGGESDERHLWPEMFRLVRECKPAICFGEQVASPDGLRWLDGVFADLEGAGYACGASDLCAAGLNAPHIRQRLYWVAIANEQRHDWRQGSSWAQESKQHHQTEASPIRGGLAVANGNVVQRVASAWQQQVNEQDSRSDRLEHSASDGRQQRRSEPERWSIASGCGDVRLGESFQSGLEGLTGNGDSNGRPDAIGPVAATGPWSDFRVIECLDGKSRRVGCGVQPLAHGIPAKLGSIKSRMEGLGIDAKSARRNRVGRLRGYGNAIVPQVAAMFVRCVMDVLGI